jgi:hypothetical protein
MSKITINNDFSPSATRSPTIAHESGDTESGDAESGDAESGDAESGDAAHDVRA